MRTLRTSLRPRRTRLEQLARRVEPVATWDDLVLPEAAAATLREIAAQVRNRPVVHDGWGFASRGARGLGITALFTGEWHREDDGRRVLPASSSSTCTSSTCRAW